MFDNIDKRWIKKILIALVFGFLSGEMISKLLGLFLTSEAWALFLEIWVPGCIVFGLLWILKE